MAKKPKQAALNPKLPQVCVVTPSLNSGNYLDAALYSVLRQDYPALQSLVVDGGSTDASLSLLERFTPWAEGRLQWISCPDNGPAAAVNAGFEAALANPDSQIIGWLNADDYYAEHAVSRAVTALQKNPHWVMVYGEAHHIDAHGADIGAYPTKPPKTPLQSFKDGSFICQPTAFFRREVFEAGLLDESYSTAFDFEWWLRIFKRFPGRIGMVNSVQAYSRLHPGCLTRRLRDVVALESIRAIQSHIGPAPLHWLLTRVDELCASYLQDESTAPLATLVQDFVLKALPGMDAATRTELIERLKSDARLRMARPNAFVAVQPDGWVGRRVTVRWRGERRPSPSEGQNAVAPSVLTLKCQGSWPRAGKLRLSVRPAVGGVQHFTVDAREEFVIQLDLPSLAGPSRTSWTIESADIFVPSRVDKKLNDARELSFKVESLFVS